LLLFYPRFRTRHKKACKRATACQFWYFCRTISLLSKSWKSKNENLQEWLGGDFLVRGGDLEVFDYLKERSQLLDISSIMNRFSKGELSEKSFAVLIAEKLGFEQIPGFVLSVEDMRLKEVLCITESSLRMEFKKNDRFHYYYDFRNNFVDLHSWLVSKPKRPSYVIFKGVDATQRIQEAIKKGNAFAKSFRIIVQKIGDVSPIFGTATAQKNKVYIEVSHTYSVAHGDNCAAYVDNGKGELVQYFSIRHGDKEVVLPNTILKRVATLTKRLCKLIGEGCIIEWGSRHDEIFLHSAQRSIRESFPFILTESHSADRYGMRIIFPGKLEGTIKRPSDILFRTFQNSKGERYIILCERPDSRLVTLLPYAKGFVFEKGGLLCHLALLLREAKVPAVIMDGALSCFRSGDTINMDIGLSDGT